VQRKVGEMPLLTVLFDVSAILMLPFVVMALVISIPIIAIWTAHKRSLYQMKLSAQQHGDERILAQIAEVRKEIQALRDTSTQYDISFDTALQRVEMRLGSLEGRVGRLEQSTAVSTSIGASAQLP